MASEKTSAPPLAQEKSRDPEVALPAPSNPGQNDDASGQSAKDEAMAIVGEQEHALDPAVVARAVRKIDFFLIPAMIFGCESCAGPPLPSRL
jgi:hypothetical protein